MTLKSERASHCSVENSFRSRARISRACSNMSIAFCTSPMLAFSILRAASNVAHSSSGASVTSAYMTFIFRAQRSLTDVRTVRAATRSLQSRWPTSWLQQSAFLPTSPCSLLMSSSAILLLWAGWPWPYVEPPIAASSCRVSAHSKNSSSSSMPSWHCAMSTLWRRRATHGMSVSRSSSRTAQHVIHVGNTMDMVGDGHRRREKPKTQT
mmetsp:Transcript_84670/g.218232  ORF Transcript_84670/g.218232 Transcript_84670/m.218232 type:complete len:209 (+) Transcript_84670:666-1292(+)